MISVVTMCEAITNKSLVVGAHGVGLKLLLTGS